MFEQLIIVGNLGRDPELRYTSAGVPVCSFSVAVTKKWTGQDGTQHENTKWFKVSAWRKLAETCHQYLAKGRQVMVVGTVDVSAYTGQDGAPKASIEVTADTVKFLGGRTGTGHDEEFKQDEDEAPARRQAASSNGRGKPAPAPEYDEEEIPF